VVLLVVVVVVVLVVVVVVIVLLLLLLVVVVVLRIVVIAVVLLVVVDVVALDVVVIGFAVQYPSAPHTLKDAQHCLPQQVFVLRHVPPGQHCSATGSTHAVAPPKEQQVSVFRQPQTNPLPSQHCCVAGL